MGAIRIFTTGGTIDGCTSNLPTKKASETIIPDLLKQARITVDYVVENLMCKHSEFITARDRELILKKCLNCKEGKIVITHGTITLSATAKFLGEKIFRKQLF